MTPGIARQASTLAALLTALVRSGEGVLSPSALAVAGTVGLTVYGVLAIGPPLAQRLLAPPRPAAFPPADTSSP